MCKLYIRQKGNRYIFGLVKTNSLNCLINKSASPTPTFITKLFQTERKRTTASIFLSKKTVAGRPANELPGHILCATPKLLNSSSIPASPQYQGSTQFKALH